MMFGVIFQNILIIGIYYIVFFIFSQVKLSSLLVYRSPFGWHALMVSYYWKDANEDP